MTISAADILAVTKKVTREWTRQRKAEERGSRSRLSRQYVYSDRVNFTDVADAILPGAYQHASGGGRYTVAKRQFFYACREAFKKRTGRELEYTYFANTLLVQYLNRHPETAAWKVTADPRGTLTIPNAGHKVRVPVGTIPIDNHLLQAGQRYDPFAVDAAMRVEWPSLAAGRRYQAVLYIEKEGFEPLLEEAKIAERYDLAIISCKGQSVVAARRFVDRVCALGRGVPLLVVHDFDKAGFEIAQRLTTVSDWAEDYDRVTYRFQNEIDVHDLGLRLEDVEAYDLADERCEFKGHFAADSIATKEEKAFLRSGRRVELNAFTSPQFIEWLEAKLDDHLPERLIPADDVLVDAYRRALIVAKVNATIRAVLDNAVAAARTATVPTALRQQLREHMEVDDEQAWDKALYDLVVHELRAEETPLPTERPTAGEGCGGD
jgi:hypothetical protein